jgi:N-formylglutamate deformylase
MLTIPEKVFELNLPALGVAKLPLVLDSPHSGKEFPADFGAAMSIEDLRHAEDTDIDDLYSQAPSLGVPLLCARFPRTYIDPNRHIGDIDLELLDQAWPDEFVPSGKAVLGKALVWRNHDDGRPIYARKLTVNEVRHRIAHYVQPYQRALEELIVQHHQLFGVSYHLNCHSMEAVGGAMGEGGAGKARADFVLGDRDGTSCSQEFTQIVAAFLRGRGYGVAINDPYKGVELVRAYSDPLRGKHSLQIELNKRLYLTANSLQRNAQFAQTKTDLTALIGHLADYTRSTITRTQHGN